MSKKKKAFLRSTDAGNAEFFAGLYKDRLRYDHSRKRWLIWREHWWEEDHNGEVYRLAKQAMRLRGQSAQNIADDDKRRDEIKWAVRSESKYHLIALLELAKNETPLADAGTGWDADLWLLGVANGVVDLRTGTLRAGRPEDRITLHTGVPFDPDAPCPRWQKFLEEVFGTEPEILAYVHRFVGYCASGSTKEQCLLLCHGPGGNGKSTFLEAIRYVLGPYAYNLPFSAFERKARSSIPNEVAATAGKRLVTAVETDERAMLNAARIKAMTGGDKQTGRFLYGQLFEFDATAKLVLAFNHKPRIEDTSDGIWRRIRLLPFERRFGGDSADKELLEKLKTEAPGILAWAVSGCVEWQKDGLNVPERVRVATQDYRLESGELDDFLEDRCVIDPGASVPVGQLYAAYADWASTLRFPLNRNQFKGHLEARGLKQARVGEAGTRVWTGICLGITADNTDKTDTASQTFSTNAPI